jgi:hypothetical protein
MPAWKVLLVLLFAILCMGMVTATVIVPLNYSGNERWAWLGGLAVGSILMIGLFVLFLRYADRTMDTKR